MRELLLAGKRKVTEIVWARDLDPADILEDIETLAQDQRVPIREVSRKALDQLSMTESSQGVIARAKPVPEASLEDLAANPHAFLLALDGITDPHNLGAILRTAECVGVSGVILPRHRSVHISPTVTKTAVGAVEHLDLALVGGIPSAIDALKKANIWVIGLDGHGERPLHDVGLGKQPVCLVIGAEGRGLSRLARQRCDQIAHLPMHGHIGSLNAGVAAAVGMYEVLRQRAAG